MSDRPRRRTVVGGMAAAGTLFPAWTPAPARTPENPDMIVSPIVELRQYTLHPGRRDILIDLFEREFVETQEAAGATVIGQFRDLDAPDRYVWLRGFPDMEARKAALEAFYFGPVWQAHRTAANATLIDSDNVLLLRPLDAASGFSLGERAPVGASGPGRGVVVASVHALSGPDDALPVRFREAVAPRLAAAGLAPRAVLTTEASPNTFPRLPVREGERVLVWLAAAADPDAADAAIARARADPGLEGLLDHPLQLMRLQPTARSRLHG
ncbi:NIPSNAP family protein [Brevundimonas sp.]|uniref:NIPSNAP family protein n=1 Tax=Brevundimonas sp. TaxID=1871086 RepID=UPI002D071C93|nr:NIPSNAP family protein [Brevundimonas sp.]HWQ85667.1 NIPSNAP family protein [Brevundimonas sp.]